MQSTKPFAFILLCVIKLSFARQEYTLRRNLPASGPRIDSQRMLVPILKEKRKLLGYGSYVLDMGTGNGIKLVQSILPGSSGAETLPKGSYSFKHPDGTVHKLSYIKDGRVFRDLSDMLPRELKSDPLVLLSEKELVPVNGITSIQPAVRHLSYVIRPGETVPIRIDNRASDEAHITVNEGRKVFLKSDFMNKGSTSGYNPAKTKNRYGTQQNNAGYDPTETNGRYQGSVESKTKYKPTETNDRYPGTWGSTKGFDHSKTNTQNHGTTYVKQTFGLPTRSVSLKDDNNVPYKKENFISKFNRHNVGEDSSGEQFTNSEKTISRPKFASTLDEIISFQNKYNNPRASFLPDSNRPSKPIYQRFTDQDIFSNNSDKSYLDGYSVFVDTNSVPQFEKSDFHKGRRPSLKKHDSYESLEDFYDHSSTNDSILKNIKRKINNLAKKSDIRKKQFRVYYAA